MTAWSPAHWRPVGLAAALAASVAALSAGAYCALKFGLAWRCPIMLLLHLPCPSCGTTRALAALCELDFVRALRFQPLAVLAIPAGPLVWAYAGWFRAHPRIGWTALIAAVSANWIYLLLFLPR